MNRKNKDKDTQNSKEEVDSVKYIEPIEPKFNANWAQGLRFDRIIINLSDCSYDVITKVAKELKWKVQKNPNNTEWDLWWTDWHVLPETLMKMQQHQKINHFPGMVVLSRKNMLAKNLMRLRKKAPEQYAFFPLTWNLPSQYSEFKTYFDTKPKGKARTYIVKPESLSQGKGIFLTRRIEDINPSQHCVVQRYLSKPYLIDGLKFDLRVYVLLASVDPLRVYVYQEGLGRFATEPYIVPNKDNITDVFMHLTNYAINKQSEKFVFNENSEDMTVGHKRSLTAVYNNLAQNGHDVSILKDKINQLIVKTIISGLPHLKFLYKSCQPENYRSDMCFQILGFDVIICEDLEPFLLQINYTPSFSTDTPLDETIKKNLIKDTLTLIELNTQIKENVVKQRKQFRQQRMMTGKQTKYTAAEKAQKKQIMLSERDEYVSRNLGSFTPIYPLDESLSQQNRQKMKIYNEMMSFADQLFTDGTRVKKEANLESEQKRPSKLEKLPSLGVQSKENVVKKILTTKFSEKRIPGSLSITKRQQPSLMKLQDKTLKLIREKSHQDKIECANPVQVIEEISAKATQKIRLKEIVTGFKRPVQTRESLIPKTIQFQGNKFDGLCDQFVKALKRQ